MILRKGNMPHMLESLWVQVFQENMIGQSNATMEALSLVFLHKALLMPRRSYILKKEVDSKIQRFNRCIERRMEIMHQANRRKEITIGSLNQMIIFLDIKNKKS